MFVLMSLYFMAAPETAPATPVAPTHDDRTSFKTTKTLGELERCLTDRLSKFGEVTSVPIEGMKTLMFRTTDEPPMMIDISPPTVTVTTKFAVWTRPIIQTCM